MADVLNDGAVPTNPLAINFLTSGYNGSPGTPGSVAASIADYWIWKYANRPGDTYSNWQHIRSTGDILAGEGFTMKGVSNTGGSISTERNYVFSGKPNNGDITLAVAAGNDYLVGNPYPSALDADEFILDNISVADGGRNSVNVINGALYFWEHFASNTHILAEYQGGYGMYTLMGGVQAINNDSRINSGGSLTATKTPERYIPVGQGFFVYARNTGDSNTVVPVGGDILFKNSQRVFRRESDGNSTFMKSSNTKGKSNASKGETDTREKIRLNFSSPKGYYREILAGVDQNATNDIDLGYDADLFEDNKEDMYWTSLNGEKLIIQAVGNFDEEQILPLGIKISKDGLSNIGIENLENIDASKNIYLYDKALNLSKNLKEGHYEVFLTAGTYNDRFEITFKDLTASSLGIDDLQNNELHAYFSNEKQSFIIHNPNLKEIKSVEVLNILGQSILQNQKYTNRNLHNKNRNDRGHTI